MTWLGIRDEEMGERGGRSGRKKQKAEAKAETEKKKKSKER